MTPGPLDASQQDGATVVRLAGEIDVVTAAELGDALVEAVPSSSLGLVLELSGVRYVDSAGIRMFFGVARQLTRYRQALGLALPDASPLQRLIKVTDLGEVATICAEIDDCITGLRGIH